MRCTRSLLAALCCLVPAAAQAEVPTDWIEATGHRVIRLTGDAGGSSFYFHQNAYTAKGDKLVVSTRGGFAVIDLSTLGKEPCKIDNLATGAGRTPVLGKKTRILYYVKGPSIFGTNIDTKETREIIQLPQGLSGASGLALNADETLLASTGSDPKAKELAKDKGGDRSMCLFTVAVKSAAIKKIHHCTRWLNHTQFSPTDPMQLMFCHEGKWDDQERIWIIRADGTGLKKIHNRTLDHEIFGHEFFSPDGKWTWYDLQTPRSTVFWLAGLSLETGERIRYKLERSQWSVHYNESPDGKLFAGDGGGPNSVAKPGNGQWIYLFTPSKELKVETVENPMARDGAPAKEEWKTSSFSAEKLVDLSKHDYKLEPNVTFTPDGKWIVFRSNMHGTTHVYAVEVKKSK